MLILSTAARTIWRAGRKCSKPGIYLKSSKLMVYAKRFRGSFAATLYCLCRGIAGRKESPLEMRTANTIKNPSGLAGSPRPPSRAAAEKHPRDPLQSISQTQRKSTSGRNPVNKRSRARTGAGNTRDRWWCIFALDDPNHPEILDTDRHRAPLELRYRARSDKYRRTLLIDDVEYNPRRLTIKAEFAPDADRQREALIALTESEMM
jgi:hypothetical protein